jgi:hypothetical protein
MLNITFIKKLIVLDVSLYLCIGGKHFLPTN